MNDELEEIFFDPFEEVEIKERKSWTLNLKIDFSIDYNFWAIIPAININFHSITLEFEWLCFALYIDKK